MTTWEALSPPYVTINNYIGVEYINESIDTPLANLERCFQVTRPENPLGTRHCSGVSQVSTHLLSTILLRDEKSTAMITLLQMGNKPRKFMQFFQGCAIKEWQDRGLSPDCLAPGTRYDCGLTCMLEFRGNETRAKTIISRHNSKSRCNPLLRECLKLHVFNCGRATLYLKKKKVFTDGKWQERLLKTAVPMALTGLDDQGTHQKSAKFVQR